jgi:hypothetical protein
MNMKATQFLVHAIYLATRSQSLKRLETEVETSIANSNSNN